MPQDTATGRDQQHHPAPRRVLVTGGAGFIGANLVRRLAGRADIEEVRVIDDRSGSAPAVLEGLGVTDVTASVLNRRALQEAMDGCDAVVHLAARISVPGSVEDPVDCHQVNTTGTLRVLEAARQQGGVHVVLASSAAVYGTGDDQPSREVQPVAPVSPYAASKAAAESFATAYAASYDLPVLPLRFFNVYGPGQPVGHGYAAVIPTFLQAALRGDPIVIDGDGRQTRDFTFVDDVTRALADAVVRRVTSPAPVNLAHGVQVPLLRLVGAISGVVDRTVEVSHGPARAGDVRHSQADATRCRELFPSWEATPLEEGLRATAEWLAAQQVPRAA